MGGKLREEADHIIASVSTEIDVGYDNGCMGNDHSTKCLASFELDFLYFGYLFMFYLYAEILFFNKNFMLYQWGL